MFKMAVDLIKAGYPGTEAFQGMRLSLVKIFRQKLAGLFEEARRTGLLKTPLVITTVTTVNTHQPIASASVGEDPMILFGVFWFNFIVLPDRCGILEGGKSLIVERFVDSLLQTTTWKT